MGQFVAALDALEVAARVPAVGAKSVGICCFFKKGQVSLSSFRFHAHLEVHEPPHKPYVFSARCAL